MLFILTGTDITPKHVTRSLTLGVFLQNKVKTKCKDRKTNGIKTSFLFLQLFKMSGTSDKVCCFKWQLSN